MDLITVCHVVISLGGSEHAKFCRFSGIVGLPKSVSVPYHVTFSLSEITTFWKQGSEASRFPWLRLLG